MIKHFYYEVNCAVFLGGTVYLVVKLAESCYDFDCMVLQGVCGVTDHAFFYKTIEKSKPWEFMLAT